MSDIGDRLRSARQNRGLSLPEVAARTRIPVWILESIERGEYARLPGGVFLRGFLRAFAREVGLDPEMIIAEYVTSQGAPAAACQATATPTDVGIPAEAHASTSRAWSSLALAAAALGALLWLDAPPRTRDSDVSAPAAMALDDAAATSTVEDVRPTISEQAMAGTTEVVVSDSQAFIEDARASGSERARGELDVHLQATGPLWLEATTDGRRVIYRLLDAGDEAQLSATADIRLRVGDASALRYSINGAPGRPLGGPGQVREVHITRDNHRSFTEPSGRRETD
jgi:transcriptional regulator with XRE-family HTH domain